MLDVACWIDISISVQWKVASEGWNSTRLSICDAILMRRRLL
jgi:hypothetical protein